MAILKSDPTLQEYLEPTFYVDADHPAVIAFAQKHTEGKESDLDKAVALYYAVRDGWRYNPYDLDLNPEAMKASAFLDRAEGYCIEKANILVAACRAIGIPARFGFANVRNHIGTDRLEAYLKTDLMVFHGYADIFLEGKWVKATPAFNLKLCHLLNVEPLEFNGREDSFMQQFDKSGNKYIEFVTDHGTFADWPRERFIREIKTHYGHLFDEMDEQVARVKGVNE